MGELRAFLFSIAIGKPHRWLVLAGHHPAYGWSGHAVGCCASISPALAPVGLVHITALKAKTAKERRPLIYFGPRSRELANRTSISKYPRLPC
jgi:hypothetical protein